MKKFKPGSFLFSVMKYASLILASVISLTPVLVCVITAFKTNDEYAATSVLDMPASFMNFDNFKIAFEKANMLRGFLNTGLVPVSYTHLDVYKRQEDTHDIERWKNSKR